jgi:hypothetical protein
VACATVKSNLRFGEIFVLAHKSEMKSVQYTPADFTAKRFHPAQRNFTRPQGRISLKKA